MQRILLLSDSHGNLEPARRIIEAERPDRVIHLGDLEPDARRLQALFPSLRLAWVPGNCDHKRGPECIGVMAVEGCRIYYTHGHEHNVKWGLLRLQLAAEEAGARVAAFGHTHQPYCQREGGLWLVNPGSCQRQPNYAMIEIEQGVPHCSLHVLKGENTCF